MLNLERSEFRVALLSLIFVESIFNTFNPINITYFRSAAVSCMGTYQNYQTKSGAGDLMCRDTALGTLNFWPVIWSHGNRKHREGQTKAELPVDVN